MSQSQWWQVDQWVSVRLPWNTAPYEAHTYAHARGRTRSSGDNADRLRFLFSASLACFLRHLYLPCLLHVLQTIVSIYIFTQIAAVLTQLCFPCNPYLTGRRKKKSLESQIKEKKKCLQIKDFNIDNLLIKLPRDIVGMKKILFFLHSYKMWWLSVTDAELHGFCKKSFKGFYFMSETSRS